MNLSFGGWPVTGILAAIAIIAGIVLLVAYAVRRGLVHDDLDGTIETTAVPTSGPAPVAGQPHQSRVLGVAGASILVVGLALGLVTAIGGWGATTGGGVGDSSDQPNGCAQSWNGCPQATQGAPASVAPSTAP
jgi:hypothetical protein